MRTIHRLFAFLSLFGIIATCVSSTPANAQGGAPIKIALITDMSGVYESLSGKGAQIATQMAIDSFGGKVLGRPIELTVIDHRNNGPEGATKAREFFDQGGDLALDMTNSAVGLAVAAVAKEKHKLAIVTGAASAALTGANCNKYTYHYAYDTYALAHSTGSSIASHPDGKKWYAVYTNYAFGQQMLADFGDAIKAKGGSIVHADAVPLGTTDFSSYLLAAKNAKPQVLGFFNAGADTVNSMKQFKQFGLDKVGIKPAVGLLFLSDVDALPQVFAGVRITTSWYWNENKAARAWADQWTAKRGGGLRPTDIQAADYSATVQYLDAVKATGTTNADKLVSYLDGRQFNDFYAKGGEWRARDHRVIHEMYVVDVLPQSMVKEPHAWFHIVQVIPPGRAFRPESQSTCKKDW